MAKLDGLIRLNKYNLEEKQKALANLNNILTGLENDQKELDEERERETELARHDVELAKALGGYLKACKKKEEIILKAINSVNGQIEEAREEIRDVFAELKKYEIIQRRREEEKQKEILKKDAEELDEIAVERHHRDK